MARAYAHCIDDAPRPVELEFARAVRSFGVRAVTGRDILSAREIRDCLVADYAEKIMQLYRAREASTNWAEWEAANPKQAEVLTQVHKVYGEWQTR